MSRSISHTGTLQSSPYPYLNPLGTLEPKRDHESLPRSAYMQFPDGKLQAFTRVGLHICIYIYIFSLFIYAVNPYITRIEPCRLNSIGPQSYPSSWVRVQGLGFGCLGFNIYCVGFRI